MSYLANLIIDEGSKREGEVYGARIVAAMCEAEKFNALRDELIELRRKAEAYDRLFGTAAPVPAPHVFIQWKGTEICGDFHCECGRSGHFHGLFAYSVECSACGKVYELPINLPLIVGRDEPLVLVHVDEEDDRG